MKKTLTRTSVLLTLGWVLTCCAVATGQRMISLKPVRPVICRYSTVNRPDHIPPSDRFRQMIRSRGARVRTAILDVEYVNFPADNLAKDAFQYAIAIWESELVSSVPIHIRAEWKPLGSGVLGEALWGRAYANFGGEQHINTF